MNEEVEVELEKDAKSLSTYPYAYTIKGKHSYFLGWKTVEHIPGVINTVQKFRWSDWSNGVQLSC